MRPGGVFPSGHRLGPWVHVPSCLSLLITVEMMKTFPLTSTEPVNSATCPNFNGLVVHGHIRAEERATGGSVSEPHF